MNRPQVFRIRSTGGWLYCWINAPRLRAILGPDNDWIEVIW